eukprot:05155.XXX_203725_205300_1 [CDS] Oithona nana genome sequencing.
MFDSADKYKSEFENVRQIGSGKFGTVHQVRNVHSGDVFAAKVVKTRKKAVLEMVNEEVSILKNVCHDNILSMIGAYQGGNEVIMVTEYLQGGELFEKVASDDYHLTEMQCVQFMHQICEGVSYLHRKDIVHLDLKPENVVLVLPDSNKIKIIDFGFAKKLNSDQQIVRVLQGTPEFVPPEIVNYEPIGFPSDTWSIGVVAFVLLTGLSPFLGDSVQDTFTKITAVSYDFEDEEFDDISLEAKSFISHLLINKMEDRLTAEECLHHPWLSMETKRVMKTLKKDNLKKFLTRRRWQRGAQAVLALKRI